ncbi:hypothetical protein GCM10027051_05880 [Niabella terrae]
MVNDPLTLSTAPPILAEYQLTLPLRADLGNLIRDLQQTFIARYKAREAFRIPAVITLLHFHQYTTLEARIQQRLVQFARQQHPLMITLNGFDVMPTHSLYIQLGPRSVMQQLSSNLKTGLQGLLSPDREHKAFFPDATQLTIARKLKPWQFDQCWPDLKYQEFSERFIATKICLIKKRANGKGSSQFRDFEFEGRAAECRQTALF